MNSVQANKRVSQHRLARDINVLQNLRGLLERGVQESFNSSKKVEGTDNTACIEEFFEAEKGIENAIKSTNFISKFCTLKSVMKLKLFLLCYSLFLDKFEFNYTF